MRVLHCIWRMGSGGAEHQLALLAAGLVARGVDNHVAFVYRGETYERFRASGSVLHEIHASHNYDVRVLPRLLALTRRIQPTVINTWLAQMDVIGGLASRALSLPWILSERSVAANYPPTALYCTRALLGRFASAIVANSAGGALYWRGRAGRAQIHVIPNGVPIASIEAATPVTAMTTGIPDDERVILGVGRLSAEKNFATLIDAVSRIADAERIWLVLCGDGALEPALRARVRTQRMEARVHFAGFVGDIWSWLRRASVYVSLSGHEGHPNATLEAMAASVPVVLSDIPAHREIADETSASFVPANDVEAVAEAVRNALRCDDRVSSRVRQARRRVEHYSVERMVAEYEPLYRMLTRGPVI